MLGDKFTLEYSPQFYDEISDAIRYITFKLRNPEAAQRLKDDAESAILDRLDAIQFQNRDRHIRCSYDADNILIENIAWERRFQHSYIFCVFLHLLTSHPRQRHRPGVVVLDFA